jgi:hypothetical protein
MLNSERIAVKAIRPPFNMIQGSSVLFRPHAFLLEIRFADM